MIWTTDRSGSAAEADMSPARNTPKPHLSVSIMKGQHSAHLRHRQAGGLAGEEFPSQSMGRSTFNSAASGLSGSG